MFCMTNHASLIKDFVGGSKEENKVKFLEAIQWPSELSKPINSRICF